MPHLSAAVRSGNLLFLSGQLAFNADGQINGGIAEQTGLCLDRIEQVLRDHALDRNAIVKAGVWLTDQGDFAGFDAAYAAFFGDHKPARSTVISGLAISGALIEIDAVASFAMG